MDNADKTALISGEEFEKALTEAANVKKENLTSVRTRNKDNYNRFYEIMLVSTPEIQSILYKKRKDRSDDDNRRVKEFKKHTSQAYRQICQLIAPEELEDGEQTRVQKLVGRIAPIVRLMAYIGHREIEDEFRRHRVELKYDGLGDDGSAFANEQVENDIRDVFERGKSLRDEADRNTEAIKTTIFETSVPHELQFDRSMNPTGIKSSDFCRLVDLKTKQLMAADDEAQEKVDEQISDLAGQVEFDNMRNKLIQAKLIDLQRDDSAQGA